MKNTSVRKENGKSHRYRAEDLLFGSLSLLGIQFHSCGWPDLLCIHNGELLCIEVKRNPMNQLTQSQRDIMTKLQESGIRCVRWDPFDGFKDLNGKPVHGLTIGGQLIEIRHDLFNDF